MKIVFRKSAGMLESRGIDYTFDEYSNIKYPDGWINAFRDIGFEKITREEAEKALGFDDPMEVQDDNTYNESAHVWKDINYGITEVPVGAPAEVPFKGQTILVFKVHQGGDIRSGYSQNTYMVYPDSKETLIHEIVPVISPEITFTFENEDGERISSGRLLSGGFVEFDMKHPEIDEETVWQMMEESGSQTKITAEV